MYLYSYKFWTAIIWGWSGNTRQWGREWGGACSSGHSCCDASFFFNFFSFLPPFASSLPCAPSHPLPTPPLFFFLLLYLSLKQLEENSADESLIEHSSQGRAPRVGWRVANGAYKYLRFMSNCHGKPDFFTWAGCIHIKESLSVLMCPKLSFSTRLDLVALKAVLSLTIYNLSDPLSCKIFRVLFWLQVLNCCSSPADIAQNLPKAFFCRYKLIWISFLTICQEILEHISSKKQVLFLWPFLYRRLSTPIHIWFVFYEKKFK